MDETRIVTEKKQARTILITGAAGNLGSRLASYLMNTPHRLRLLIHKTPLSEILAQSNAVEKVQADLGHAETLHAAVVGVDTVVHFAGVLFAPFPERFLPTTNTHWFDNLLNASLAAGVDRIVLISFPHVEGPTSPDQPAAGRLDRSPISIHAQTRLEEERLLFSKTEGTATTPVSLRLGMVYGKGILMIEAARWLAQRRLLAVWPQETGIHLISTEDFLRATAAAAIQAGIKGIYQVGDEQPITLQAFLDEACRLWQLPRPWRFPLGWIYLAAWICEMVAALLKRPSPLTRDFITIGRVSYWGDTLRCREELIPNLVYPSFQEGKQTLL